MSNRRRKRDLSAVEELSGEWFSSVQQQSESPYSQSIEHHHLQRVTEEYLEEHRKTRSVAREIFLYHAVQPVATVVGLISVFWGALLLNPWVHTFQGSTLYQDAASWMSEEMWGGIAFSLGVATLWALARRSSAGLKYVMLGEGFLWLSAVGASLTPAAITTTAPAWAFVMLFLVGWVYLRSL